MRFLPLKTLFVLALCTVAASAQETRATLTGHVVDSTGAVVPKAHITVTDQETGVKTLAVSTGDGVYTVPFLQPGKYSIAVTATGFGTTTREGVTLQSGDHLGLDLSVAVGTSTEVNVTADAPLVQTATATASQVLTAEEVENLPDNGRSPLALAKTEYGVVPKQKNSVVRARPFDNSAASDFSIGGGNSQSNEYLLNGVVNMQDSSRLPGFSPFQDAVSEVRVDVFQANASFGDTSGGTVNMTTKAGTNKFHGTLSEFNQFSAINAPQRWFAGTAKQFATRQNQYGGTIGGPVWIPHLINGHDKFFFFYAYEGFKGSTPAFTTKTVPTAAERNGDFSALLPLGCTATAGAYNSATGLCANGSPSTYQLYNPFTGTATRTPIPNNNLNALAASGHPLNPVALKYLQFFPQPNQPGLADGQNNYVGNLPNLDDYNSHEGRLDYTPNETNHFTFETHRSEYQPTSGRAFPNIATGTRGYTVYQGGMLDYIHTFSVSATMDNRLSLTRSYRNSQIASAGFDAATLGFPSYMQSSGLSLLPSVSFSDSSVQTLGSPAGTNSAFDTGQYFSSLTLLHGAHTANVGIDIRQNKNALLNVGNSTNVLLANGSNPPGGGYTSGYFLFGTNFVTANPTAAAPPFGGSLGSFLLGLPTSGQFNVNPQATYNDWYFAGFAQDDWKVMRSLTLNYGLRFESETSITEAHNKGVYFDPTATNSATVPAATNYAAAPYSGRPASAFSAAGGLRFLGANGNRNFEYFTPAVNVSPRIGLSYAPEAFHDKMVVRAGFGIFYNPFNDYYTPQNYGFSSLTQYNASNNGFVTPAASLSDPFPSSNSILQPTGSALGTNTFLGTPITTKPNSTLKTSYSERWNFDIQYQLSPNTMINVGYIGNHQVNQPFTNAIGQAGDLPFLSRNPRGPNFDPVSKALGTASVPNPFKGVAGIQGGLATATLVTPYQILENYPQYESGSGFTGNSVSQQLTPGGSAQFHEVLFRFQKRASNGLALNVNFEYSHNLSTSQLNPGDATVYQENASDFPVHLAIAGVYALPIGRGKSLLSNVNPFVDALIGGFTVNTIYQYLSGAPIQWGTQPYFANGTNYDPRLKISPRAFGGAIDKSLFGLTTEQPSSVYNYRTFPTFYGRQDATNNLDASILKNFAVGERFRLQYRFEAYNVLNHTSFGTPNVGSPGSNSASFGVITSTSSAPRVLQQGLRLTF